MLSDDECFEVLEPFKSAEFSPKNDYQTIFRGKNNYNFEDILKSKFQTNPS
jgi:hypothetical protein